MTLVRENHLKHFFDKKSQFYFLFLLETVYWEFELFLREEKQYDDGGHFKCCWAPALSLHTYIIDGNALQIIYFLTNDSHLFSTSLHFPFLSYQD